jgi:broad specificity phosphatase PhoE
VQYFKTQERDTLGKKCRIVFIESSCDNTSVVNENILRAKFGNDDFKHIGDSAEVVREFNERIKQYEKVYERITPEESLSYIKIIDVKQHFEINDISGGIGSRMAFFLLNLHPIPYPVYVCSNGETEGQKRGHLGGTDRLTEAGEAFARNLHRFILERCGERLTIIHGTNPAVMNTMAPILADAHIQEKLTIIPLRTIDDVNYGGMHGLSLETCRSRHPVVSKLLFEEDPAPLPEECKGKEVISQLWRQPSRAYPRLNYCMQFPQGESYRQVMVRLESALMEIMRCPNAVLFVSAYVPAQGALAFLTDIRPELSPSLHLPLHEVVEVGIKDELRRHDLSGS